MVQTARPTSDITADSWTTAPLWSKVSDASDATLITGPSGATTQCEVALGSLSDPVSSNGHIVYARAKVNTGSGGGEKLTWYLYQGATLRATSAATTISRTTITTYSYTLSAAEADSLTAYTDLRVRLAQTTIGSGELLNVYDVWMEVPDAPVTGTGTVAFAKPALAASGAETLTGTAALAFAGPSLAGTGTHTAGATTGTGAVAFARPALEAAGGETFSATGAVAFAKPAMSGTGSETLTGAGGIVLAAPGLSGAGTESFSGNVATVFGLPTLNASGTVTSSGVTGFGGIVFGPLAIMGTGAETFTGSGAMAFAVPALSGSGYVGTGGEVTGTGGVTFAKPTFGATGIGDGSTVFIPISRRPRIYYV